MSRPGVEIDPAPAAVKVKARAERLGWAVHRFSARATEPLPVCGWASTALWLRRDHEHLTLMWVRPTAHSKWQARRAWLWRGPVVGLEVMGVKAAAAYLSS